MTGVQTWLFRSPLIRRLLKSGRVNVNSWLDLFFTKDVHIVGLSLDYVETDLWWLITYRARRKLENEKKTPIFNRITYYYPKAFEKNIQPKLEMLRANEVFTKGIGFGHNLGYYDKIFDVIKSEAR